MYFVFQSECAKKMAIECLIKTSALRLSWFNDWVTEVNTYADNIRSGYCLVPLNEKLPAIGKQGDSRLTTAPLIVTSECRLVFPVCKCVVKVL